MKRTLLIILLVLVLCTSGSFIARALNMSGMALSGLAILIESIAAAITVRNPSSSVTVTDVTTVVAPTVSTEGTGTATVSGIATGISLPETPVLDELFWLTSDGSPGICEAGGGTFRTLCYWDGDSWEPVIPPVEFTATDTLQSVVSRGGAVNTAEVATPVIIGGTTHSWRLYQDGPGVLRQRACTNDGATCFTVAKQLETGSDWELRNESGTSCGSFDSVTMAWTPAAAGTGTCAPNLATRKQALVFPAAGTYAMLDADCGTTIVGSGAGPLTVNLLADPTGCVLCVFETSAQTIKLEPNGSDSFVVNGLTPAAGDSITLALGVGNNLCVQGASATQWLVFLGTGSVSDTD